MLAYASSYKPLAEAIASLLSSKSQAQDPMLDHQTLGTHRKHSPDAGRRLPRERASQDPAAHRQSPVEKSEYEPIANESRAYSRPYSRPYSRRGARMYERLPATCGQPKAESKVSWADMEVSSMA